MPVRSKSLLPLLAAGLALAGCPDVSQTGPNNVAVATFDTTTATIPLPNDLAMQQAPGLPSGVQRELLLSFIDGGGFPADQETSIGIPIGIRTRAADGSYGATVPAAGLDLTTVTDDSVALFRIDVSPAQQFKRCVTPLTAPCWEASFASGQLVLRRNGPGGSRRWDSGAAGGRYVVATRSTIKTSDGLLVGADSTIALAAANSADLTNPESLPSSVTPAQAAQLAGLRGILDSGRAWSRVPVASVCASGGVPVAPCWLPVPNAALPSALATTEQVFPRAEIASIQTFTVQPTAVARPLTDTGSGVLPLPSDFLLDPATGKVRNIPAFGPAAAGLATLDGFSTTAPLLIPLSAPADATTITTSSVLLLQATKNGVALGPVPATVPLFANPALFNGTQKAFLQPPTTVTNGQTSTLVIAPAVTLDPAAPIYLPPLDENSEYVVVVTNGVKDAQGNALKRSTLMDLLFTFQGDLCSPAGQASCTSRVPGVANADAAGLQALRASLAPLLGALSLKDCSNGATCAVLAYTVKTQTVTAVSKQLAAAPYGIETGAQPPAAIFTPAASAAIDPATVGIPLAAFPNVQGFVQATVPLPDATDHATGGLDPSFPANLKVVAVPALVAVPKCAAPPCVAPLVVFHHGLNGSRYQMLTVADSLASRGFVVAAIDMVYHGDRAFCTASAQCTTDGVHGDGVCTPNPALATPVDTTVAPGTCTTGKLLLNSSLSTVASGSFFISSNFFRIRDAIRQDQLDQAALALALARPPAQAGYPQPAANPLAAALLGTGVVVDPTKVYFGGISLGGIIGTSIAATNPRFSRAALSVPGGTLVDVFTSSPAFQANLVPLFQTLGIDLVCVQTGSDCDAATRAAQTAAFQQTLAVAKWVLDPADPVNYAATVVNKSFDSRLQPFVTAGLFSTTTAAFGQIVANDQVVPNPTNRELDNLTLAGAGGTAASSGSPGYSFTTYTSAGGVPAANGHGLLNTNFFGQATGPQVALQTAGDTLRTDFGAFLLNLTRPGAAVALP